ncbi:MAG: tetratricopeptide repeat protein [Synechococcales cyanobacterium RM1_1_8]|nr:tetratricopeptide repeat protein [Synechococcales cyanobacterium RM1_1_8]
MGDRTANIWQALQREVEQPEAQIDLAKAALYIAQVEYPELDPAAPLAQLDAMADVLGDRLPAQRYPLKVIQTINQYLFEELGFYGNQEAYYDPRNSFLNAVLERRTGIPLSLSLVYLALAKRIDFPMVGIGMPGHFIIRPRVAEMEVYVDPFHGGELLFAPDCEQRLSEVYRRPIQLQPEMLPQVLPEVTARQCLVRMLSNLKVIYLKNSQLAQALWTIDGLLVLRPDAPQERRDRGLVLYELERWPEAQASLEQYLHSLPQAEDRSVIEQLLQDMS